MFAIGTLADRLGPENAKTAYPGSTGMTAGLDQHLLLVPYNGPEIFEALFRLHQLQLAAVFCEPVDYIAGCIFPSAEFMSVVRRLTHESGVLLIFDKVLSALRMAAGGTQAFLNITPELCTLGKVVGDGQPLSVLGGRKEIMDRWIPISDCQHSSTYNGHVLGVAAGLAMARAYTQPGFYPHIHAIADRLFYGLNRSDGSERRCSGNVSHRSTYRRRRNGPTGGGDPAARPHRRRSPHDGFLEAIPCRAGRMGPQTGFRERQFLLAGGTRATRTNARGLDDWPRDGATVARYSRPWEFGRCRDRERCITRTLICSYAR